MTDASLPETEPPILAALRQWRHDRAREDHVPSYVVMPNALMYEMAALHPTTEDDLLAVRGMGPARMLRYGEDLLGLLRAHERSSGPVSLLEPPPPREPKRSASKRSVAPDPWEISESTPYTVAIEYRISEEIRGKLVDELDRSRGPASLGLCRVLEAGPARMTLRVEWVS